MRNGQAETPEGRLSIQTPTRPWARALVGALGLALALGSVALGVTPGGPQVRVSAMGPDGSALFWARFPAVAHNAELDQYLVVWHGEGATDEEVEIYGRLLDGSGNPVGDQFRISQTGTDGDPLSDAFEAAVSYNPDAKEYLVIWRADVNPAIGSPPGTLANDEYEVYGQRLSAAGAEIGVNDFRVSDMGGADGDATFDAFEPDVAYDPASRQYLVVWRGDDDTAPIVNDEYEIFGQRLDRNGQEVGANDFRVSDLGPDGSVLSTAGQPALAYNSKQGEFLVAWQGDDGIPPLADDENEIYAQRLNADGLELGANDLRVSDMGADGDPSLDALEPDLAYNGTADEYLVVWRGDDDTPPLVNGEFEIFGQGLDSSGAELGANDFRISSMGPDGDISFSAIAPALAYDAQRNEYLAAWWGDDDTPPLVDNESEIFAHAVGADGGVTGDDAQLSKAGSDGDPTSGAFRPALAFGSGGRHVVAWEADGPPLADEEFETFARWFGEPAVTLPGASTSAPPKTVRPSPAPRARRDRRRPRLRLAGPTLQRLLRQRAVIVQASCDERCTVRARGLISTAVGSRALRLRRARRTLAAEITATLRLRLTRRQLRAARRAIRARKRLAGTISVTAVDQAGNRRAASRKISLRR